MNPVEKQVCNLGVVVETAQGKEPFTLLLYCKLCPLAPILTETVT